MSMSDKMLEEMSVSELSSFFAGELILSIGEGKIRDKVGWMVIVLAQTYHDKFYKKGIEEGLRQAQEKLVDKQNS